MRRTVLLLFLLLPAFLLAGQDIEIRNGKHYKGDKLYTGKYVEYYDNNNIRIEKEISKGLEHGDAFHYYENGVKKEHQSYRKGKNHGIWESWNEQGVKTAEASYQNGKKHGPWTIWDDKGRSWRSGVCSSGNPYPPASRRYRSRRGYGICGCKIRPRRR